MYVPGAFQVADSEQIAAFIAEHSFAAVITQHAGAPFASHVPLLYEQTAGPLGTLVGHLARPNPQWEDAAHEPAGIPALAIFSGPHTYISPTWYAEPNTVPTWNYIAVHATGRLKLITDQERLLQLLGRTVDFYESPQPQPWRLEDQNAEFIEKLCGGIVGFELVIEKLEGKWKLNQNHTAARRERVMQVLEKSSRRDDQEVAAAMRKLPK
ncbi:FMN-binding negative transcriptional regulator [Anatilimnocola floriformis]|uniref:FMN-binding negative transcriptional regulator n=1 Tax=Anatilimnocola floriformis TaxID=2948575 RepID=UPI0020C206DD|nr:FMN-binding negative transcriptional regulator [Anatilimnocola floriformis]